MERAEPNYCPECEAGPEDLEYIGRQGWGLRKPARHCWKCHACLNVWNTWEEREEKTEEPVIEFTGPPLRRD